ncbi:MazG-like family protein [Teredinibacter franksiae]|uniref:MazG-like family protein n=1 Tax=Teredinibacter franksiae TaxID=2761453 RepID=UPI0016238DB4|nr:MazG-like family protein [Teredinibacter franksiae]
MKKELILNEFGRVAEATGKDYSFSPKSLATTVTLESAKLLNHFQWMSELDSQMIGELDDMGEIAEDVADVYIYLTVLCHKLGLDPWTVIKDKLLVNREKHIEKKFAQEPAVTTPTVQLQVSNGALDWDNVAQKIANSREEVRRAAVKLKKKAGSA